MLSFKREDYMIMTSATIYTRVRTDSDSGHFVDKPISLNTAVKAAIDCIAGMKPLSLRYEQTSNHVSFKEGNILYIISDKNSFCNELESECRRLGLIFQIYYIPKNSEQPNSELVAMNYRLKNNLSKL